MDPKDQKKNPEDMSVAELAKELEKSLHPDNGENDTAALLRKSLSIMENMAKAQVAAATTLHKGEGDGAGKKGDPIDPADPAAGIDDDGSGLDDDLAAQDDSEIGKSLKIQLEAANNEIQLLKSQVHSAEEQNKMVGQYLDKVHKAFATSLQAMEKSLKGLSQRQDDFAKSVNCGIKTLIKAKLQEIESQAQAALNPTPTNPASRTPENSRMAQVMAQNLAMQKARMQGDFGGGQKGDAVDPATPEGKNLLFKAQLQGKITEEDIQYAKINKCLPAGKSLK